MRSYCLSFFLLLTSFSYAQQGADKLRDQLESDALAYSTDELFLHIDRTQYHPGDTIFFQTYVYDRFTQQFESSSQSVWVFLHTEKGKIIDSARLQLNQALAPGWLVLPEESRNGRYYLRAYTSQMQNFSPELVCTRTLEVGPLIPFEARAEAHFHADSYYKGDTVEVRAGLRNGAGAIIRNKSFFWSLAYGEKEQEIYRIRSNPDGEALIRFILEEDPIEKDIRLLIKLQKDQAIAEVRIPSRSMRPDLQFLPEGGTFTTGCWQRIAFNAVNKRGEQLFVRGAVKNADGEVMDSIKSGRLGPGVFELMPYADERFYVELENYPGERWELPVPEEGVPVMRVEQENDWLRVLLSGIPEEGYHLAVTKNHRLVAFTKLGSETEPTVSIRTDSLPDGSAQVVLFNRNLQPVAERWLFLNNRKIQAEVIPSEERTVGGSPADIAVSVHDASGQTRDALFSIAVVDSATGLSPSTVFRRLDDLNLLGREFYDLLPIHCKREGISVLPEEELDILFLTYGWRRFHYDIMPRNQKVEKELENYDLLRVEIQNSLTKKQEKKVINAEEKMWATPVRYARSVPLLTEDPYTYYLPLPELSRGTESFILLPDKSLSRLLRKAKILEVHNEAYLEDVLSHIPDPEIYVETGDVRTPQPFYTVENVHMIHEVVVSGLRRQSREFVNPIEKRYQHAFTRTVDPKTVQSSMNLESVFERFLSFKFDKTEKSMVLRPRGIEDIPALFVLDGVALGTSYEAIEYLPVSQIHSVTAVYGLAAATMYGEEASNGAIFIETKANHIMDEYDVNAYELDYLGPDNDIGRNYQLYRPQIEFYNPPKEVLDKDPQQWIRPSLYWNREIVVMDGEPGHIQFLNHYQKGSVYVYINGVTLDGQPFSGTARYVIE